MTSRRVTVGMRTTCIILILPLLLDCVVVHVSRLCMCDRVVYDCPVFQLHDEFLLSAFFLFLFLSL